MSIADLEKRIAVLEARASIIELTAVYCRFVVKADKAGIASCYTEDGVFDRSAVGQGIARGRQELHDTYANSGPNAYLPVIHNHVIQVDGDTASGTCVVESSRGPNHPDGFVAHYEDTYRRVNGEWKIAVRKMFYYDQ